MCAMAEAIFPSLGNTQIWFGARPWTFHDLFDALNAGNLFSHYARLAKALTGGRTVSDTLPALLAEYAAFHGIVALVCAAWAVLRLRAVALSEPHRPPAFLPRRLARGGRRRAVGNQPVLWKEWFAEPGLELNWFGRMAVALFVLISFMPLIFAGIYGYLDWRQGMPVKAPDIADFMNHYARSAGTSVACLLLLGVAVRASSSISGERDRQTWDSLLTSPLEASSILYGKWLGAIGGARWGWLWLGTIWGLAVLTGGMSVAGLVLSSIAWLIYAGFVAVVGLWCSTVSRTTLKANITALSATALAGGGHWFIWGLCCLPAMVTATPGGDGMKDVALFQLFGLTPPATLALLAFREADLRPGGGDIGPIFAYALLGLAFWAVATMVLWSVTSERFRQFTGRSWRSPPHPLPSAEPPVAAPAGDAPRG
jgi:ABC-type transport system involved in multi-copper enzyme maturation permease subunit